MCLANKNINLKESYNQDIKEQVANKMYFRKEDRLYMISPIPEA